MKSSIRKPPLFVLKVIVKPDDVNKKGIKKVEHLSPLLLLVLSVEAGGAGYRGSCENCITTFGCGRKGEQQIKSEKLL